MRTVQPTHYSGALPDLTTSESLHDAVLVPCAQPLQSLEIITGNEGPESDALQGEWLEWGK